MPKLTLKKYHGNYYDLHLPDGTLAGNIQIIDGVIEGFHFTTEYSNDRDLAHLVTGVISTLDLIPEARAWLPQPA